MKILIVEDEHRIANTIKKGLEQEHYTADTAYTGTTGYDLAETGDYDIIILDVMLPDLNGIEICKRLRQKSNHTPILMLTAKGQVQDKIAGLDSGADDYLTKPFSFEELLAHIRALARRPMESFNTILKVEDLTLDAVGYSVERNNTEIKLSNKEFSLLEFLMKNPNRVFTKEQLINHVWNYDSAVLTNTVEVYMKNLRDKIDKPFGNTKPLIQTVRGFGYRIGKEK